MTEICQGCYKESPYLCALETVNEIEVIQKHHRTPRKICTSLNAISAVFPSHSPIRIFNLIKLLLTTSNFSTEINSIINTSVFYVSESSNSPHSPKIVVSCHTTNVWKAFVFQVHRISLQAECQPSLYSQNVNEINNHFLSSELYSTQKVTASPLQGLLSDYSNIHCWTVPCKHTTRSHRSCCLDIFIANLIKNCSHHRVHRAPDILHDPFLMVIIVINIVTFSDTTCTFMPQARS